LGSAVPRFNRHLRYARPAAPFLFIWIRRVAIPGGGRRRAVRAVAWLGLAWSAASSLAVYPHSLSYFNELAGGPGGGHAHFLDSNGDWGQDLFALTDWVDAH